MRYLFLLLLLTGCARRTLTVQTDYLTVENLASYYVDTPDPLLYCPPYGQRMIISWSLPSACKGMENLHLKITIRYCNREENVIVKNLRRSRGTYVYNLVNEEYQEKGGIKTYKVELYGNGCLIEEWRHQLWVNLITVNQDEEPIDFEE